MVLTWPEAMLLFEKAGRDAFPVNKRFALIGKDFVQRYQAPFVWVGQPGLKLEVVKENQKQFEQWLQQED